MGIERKTCDVEGIYDRALVNATSYHKVFKQTVLKKTPILATIQENLFNCWEGSIFDSVEVISIQEYLHYDIKNKIAILCKENKSNKEIREVLNLPHTNATRSMIDRVRNKMKNETNVDIKVQRLSKTHQLRNTIDGSEQSRPQANGG